jgi:ParB-like chromosome segregation protein Spo0J
MASDRRWIDIDAIHIGSRLRAPDMNKVAELAKSIAEIGLLNPPVIRIADEMVVNGEVEYGVPILIVGHHRILAMKQLGEETVECDVYKVDPLRAELMEIAEKLHRAELTVLERS